MREPQGTPLDVVEGFFDCIWLWQHGILAKLQYARTVLETVTPRTSRTAHELPDLITDRLLGIDGGKQCFRIHSQDAHQTE